MQDVRNPDDTAIAELLAVTGTDHEQFNDRFFTDALGIHPGQLENVEPGAFVASSKPTPDQEKEEKEQQAIKKAKKDEAARKLKDNNKTNRLKTKQCSKRCCQISRTRLTNSWPDQSKS